MLPIKQIVFIALVVALFVPVCLAEDADEVREKGIAALKESQTNPRAIVEAARFFVKAAEMYGAAGNEEKNVEMNSFLYWCKKKMTMGDIDAFTKGGETSVSTKLAAVEKVAPKIDEAQKYLDRADQFASKNPTETYLIAVRFYEVADRFKGSDAGMKALDRSLKALDVSLKEQAQDKSSAPKSTLPPVVVRAADNAPATVGTRPIPSVDEIKKAEKLIKDLLKDDYAKTDAPGRLALVTKLLQQADENKGDAASEYVLLHEARDIAVLVGDAALATDAQKRLRDAFKIDFAAMLIDLRRLEANAKAPSVATALATLLSLGTDDALAVENYDQAVRYNSRAEDLLPVIKEAALKERLKAEIPRVIALKQASVGAIAAQKILSTKPDDPEANLTAGKFALQKSEFEKAFALLAKGKDSMLSSIAKRELAPSVEATVQVTLADDWFDRAEKEPSGAIKTHMQERAAQWYGNALPALSGLAKLKIEARMKTLQVVPKTENADSSTNAAKAPVAAVETKSKTVDLLKLVDPTKDAVAGQWKMQDGTLLCTSLDRTQRIELPYKPSTEYDLHCVFARFEGNDDIGLYLICNDQRIMLSLCGWTNTIAGLRNINGKEPNMAGNPTKTKNSIINDKDYDVKVFVRKTSICVHMNDKELFNYKFDNQPFTALPGYLNLHDEKTLGLYTCLAAVRFSRIEVVERAVPHN